MKTILGIFVVGVMVGLAGAEERRISMAGEWGVRLDEKKVGVEKKWFAQKIEGKIRLPGSTDEAGLGEKNTKPANFDGLSRVWVWVGPAWYQREVEISPEWSGKRVTLFLERCHWESRVWVDEKEVGMRDSLCVAHEYDLSGVMTPGKHRLTVRVDNSHKYNMGPDAHSTSEQTQTNWNGIVGKIELRATDPVWIESMRVYPNLEKKTAKVKVVIGNATGKKVDGTWAFNVHRRGSTNLVQMMPLKFEGAEGERVLQEWELAVGADMRLWDEFSPEIYDVEAELKAKAGEAAYSDATETSFGMRTLAVQGRQFAVNGKPVFLRGTLDCCIYPLTGYAPMDVEAWRKVFQVVKAYGLNHVRYHSWCPPEAAFEAADEAGILLHVEAPQWAFDVGKDAKRDAFIEEEVRRILDVYGNHPSFGMLCMGNELSGDLAFLSKLVKFGQQHDPRHLYTSSTGWSFVPENDYTVAMVRGVKGPGTEHDFRTEDAKLRSPVVSHEIAQWTVYPNLEEIRKYTGVTRARNFELVREDLRKKGMLDQAGDFLMASGKLSVLLYKEEMEVLLRTPKHGGFQLLDLHDFPGQGTALVGALDAFWESKGLVRPEEWRRFCSANVPVVRMKKRVWTTDEIFSATAEIAYYGGKTMEDAVGVWTVTDQGGKQVAGGELPGTMLTPGDLYLLGVMQTPLSKVAAPGKLMVRLGIKGTEIENSWEIWVYPASNDVPTPPGVVLTSKWEDAKAALAAEKRVLLLASPKELSGAIPGSFLPVFWSPIWFKGGAGTMSILCDPKHPALKAFPTEMHTNWQWWDLLKRSKTMVLDEMPAGMRPVVQMVDNFSRNHRLGNIFEAKVGTGKLLVCSIDLRSDLQNRPEARQLLRSLLGYVGTEEFSPKQDITIGALERMFAGSAIAKLIAKPGNVEGAMLRVKAAAKLVELRKSEPWKKEADLLMSRAAGFDYAVRGGTWKDEVGSTWHSGDNLEVTITLPKSFAGKVYVHLHDWNNQGRVAEIRFAGKELGTLDEYAGEGVWLGLPLTAKDTADGKVVLSVRPTRANAHVDEIIVVK